MNLLDLEKIVDSNEFLSTVRDKGLVESVPMNQGEITVKYLNYAMEVLTENGINAEAFVSEYAQMFNAGNLLDHIQNSPLKSAKVNRWIYRSFMEAIKDTVGITTKDLIDKVAEKSFSDEGDKVVQSSKFMDLGFVLRWIGKRTSDYTTLTAVESAIVDEGKPSFRRGKAVRLGKVRVERRTIPTHVQELREHFGPEVVAKILDEDCAFTRKSYESIIELFKDPNARILEHSICEVDGADKCVYEIEFTPLPKGQALKNALLRGLGKFHLVPGLHKLINERDELKDELFDVVQMAEHEREFSENMAQQLHTIQRAAAEDSSHDAKNILEENLMNVKKGVVKDVASYMMQLAEYGLQNKELLPLFGMFARIGLKAMHPKRFVDGKPNRAKLEDNLRDFVDPFVNDPDEKRRSILRNVMLYHRIISKFPEKFPGAPFYLKEIVNAHPWRSVLNIFKTSEVNEKVKRTYNEQQAAIQQTLAGSEMAISKAISIAVDRARTKGKLEIQTQIENNYSVQRPYRFTPVLRDLLFNVISYGDGKAEIYAGNAPVKALEKLTENTPEFDTSRSINYIRISDFGEGLSQEDMDDTNEGLRTGFIKRNLSTKVGGGGGLEGQVRYVNEVREQKTKVQVLYSETPKSGLTIEFFFQ
jgi:signal transduction histidine kinase